MYLNRYSNPRLTGVVVKEAVKCGKNNCSCSKGDLHKWYYYLYYRRFVNDKWELKKEYINHSRVKYLRGKIKKMKDKDKVTKLRLSANLALLKNTFKYSRGNISADDLIKTIYEIT